MSSFFFMLKIWCVLIPKIPQDQKLFNCSLGSLCEEKYIFSISSFRQVNYIFHKLSGNTKHIQFQLHMSRWWTFVQNESWFFTFFTFLFCSRFYMMSTSMWPLRFKCEVFDFFQGPQCWSFESRPPSTIRILVHS